jgi:hypothetical protein
VAKQFDLFSPAPDNDSSSAPPKSRRSFEADVTRVARSSLIMRPIYEVSALRFPANGADDADIWWARLDGVWLAFAMLDVISELTEYHVGIGRKAVLDRLLPLARHQADVAGISPDDSGLWRVLGRVFDHLTNRDQRYLPFAYPFYDGVSGNMTERKFWLIKTVYSGQDQETLYGLTDEGYCAYFGLHETGAFDAAAIGNLRIKLLIDRGHVDDAIQVAEQSRRQCARKAREVRQARRAILRSIHAVAFDYVGNLAGQGVEQATQIQRESGRLHHMVLDNLLHSDGKPYGYKLQQLADRLEKLNHQLMMLSQELQQLPEDYHQHSYKLFRRRSNGAFPAMNDLLQRLLRLNETDAAQIATRFIARFDPPARRGLFDPAAVIEACDRALDRQGVGGEGRQVIQQIDGTGIDRFKSELKDDIMREAFGWLRNRLEGQPRPAALSRLLKLAARQQDRPLFAIAVAMAVFQCLIDQRIAVRQGLEIWMEDAQARFELNLPDNRLYWGHELSLRAAAVTDG